MSFQKLVVINQQMLKCHLATVHMKTYTARCRYDTVNLPKYINKRHLIARPGMGCILWIKHLFNILPLFPQLLMQYLIILDRVITALVSNYWGTNPVICFGNRMHVMIIYRSRSIGYLTKRSTVERSVSEVIDIQNMFGINLSSFCSQHCIRWCTVTIRYWNI